MGIQLPASPSCKLYEPEAIGAYAYAPAGRRPPAHRGHRAYAPEGKIGR